MVRGCSSKTLNRYRVEDGELKFDGRDSDANPSQYEVSEGKFEDGCFGAEFVAGRMKNFALLDRDLSVVKTFIDDGMMRSKASWGAISYGVLVGSPENLGAACYARPSAVFTPIPHNLEDLCVIGALVNKEPASPSLMPLKHQLESRSCPGIEIDSFTPNEEKFPETVFLDMAKAACAGVEPFCMFYTSPYDDGFCDRFVSAYHEGCDVCVMTSQMADECFGELPTSFRTSAFPYMPTRVEATDEFRKRTGYNGDAVDVVTAGGRNRDLNKFMVMWLFASKRHFFWTKRLCERDRNTVFLKDGFGFVPHDRLDAWRRRFGLAGNL